MKKNQKLLKSVKGKTMDQVSKPLPPGTLYVVCLNKPLIDLWAIKDRYSNDYFDNSVESRASIDTRSISPLYRDDRVPVMLTPEEEMLLYNEGLSDNY
jgi:hypothetical protein